jgi:hypothetical protein
MDRALGSNLRIDRDRFYGISHLHCSPLQVYQLPRVLAN